MSIDLSVYAIDARPILFRELLDAVTREGWRLIAVRGYYGNPGEFLLVADGGLESGDYLFGWRLDDPNAAEYEEALARRDGETLDRWSTHERADDLGACDYSFEEVDSDDVDPGDYRKSAPEFAKALELARVEYTIEPRTNSDFPDIVAREVCRLRGGGWTNNNDVAEVADQGGVVHRFELDL